jgi:hypothetical protein
MVVAGVEVVAAGGHRRDEKEEEALGSPPPSSCCCCCGRSSRRCATAADWLKNYIFFTKFLIYLIHIKNNFYFPIEIFFIKLLFYKRKYYLENNI